MAANVYRLLTSGHYQALLTLLSIASRRGFCVATLKERQLTAPFVSRMRYEDWDVLLFPIGEDPKVPVKEFKVACHVVHDAEFAHSNQSFGVPTVCCFVPSLRVGTPFQVSVHSWKHPPVSLFTRSYTTFVESIMFQARLYIDGRLVSSIAIDPKSTWPNVLASSFECSKNGDLEFLKFPPFRQELLLQDHWSPADDYGRIKLLISEGFPRDSFTTPVERVKNIVAFSFQHAPLDVLEASGIAWPNQSMWQRAPHMTQKPVPPLTADAPDSHAHSPRRCAQQADVGGYTMPIFQDTNPASGSNSSAKNTLGFASEPPEEFTQFSDVYLDGLGQEVAKNDRKRAAGGRKARKSSTDISMPDYVPLGAHWSNKSDNIFASFPISEDDDASIGSIGTIQGLVDTPSSRSNPVVTDNTMLPFFRNSGSIPTNLAATLTSSLLNQPGPSKAPQSQARLPPATEVKSRKENQVQARDTISPPADTSPLLNPEGRDNRKASQHIPLPTGASLGVGTVASLVKGPHFAEDQEGVDPATRDASASTNEADLVKEFTPDTALRVVSGNSESSNKRARVFTPASAKATDNEDDPSRGSPRFRLAPPTQEN